MTDHDQQNIKLIFEGRAEDVMDSTNNLSDDLLRGADVIAEFVFGDPKARRKVYHLASEAKGRNRLPVFRLGNTICARRSTLLHWIAEQEGQADGQAA